MRKLALIVAALALLAVAAPAAAGGRPLTADLDAANEVGPGGDVGATGFAHVTLNQGQGEVCFHIDTDGLTTAPVAAHIHVGVAGVNGGVVVNLDWAGNGSSGCVSADADTIKAIRQNPDGYYINVHNPTVPSGAVRGQLSK